MNNFKVGNNVYWIEYGLDAGILYPAHIELKKAVITCVSEKNDKFYIDDQDYDWFYDDESFYKSKKECIDAFKKRLDEL